MYAASIPHEYSIDIEQADIDFHGHVNNASYLKWVQAVIIGHWQRLAPAEALARLQWVALRHEITYRKPAFLNDDVVATVVLKKVYGARAFFEVAIRRGEVVLAEVKSSWCCIDASTHRPTRLSTNLIERFLRKPV